MTMYLCAVHLSNTMFAIFIRYLCDSHTTDMRGAIRPSCFLLRNEMESAETTTHIVLGTLHLESPDAKENPPTRVLFTQRYSEACQEGSGKAT